MSHIKEEIHKTLLTKTNKINSAVLRRDWFKQSKLYQDINKEITFTDNISEQIYCIMNDIKTIPKCPSCNNKLNFKTFTSGYYKTCNNMICVRKNNKWKSCSKTKHDNNNNSKRELYNKFISNEYKLHKKSDVMEYINKRVSESNEGKSGRFVNTFSNMDILCSIIYYTKDIILPNQEFKWNERFYILSNNLTDIPKCIECGKQTKFINFSKGYQATCSSKCVNKGYAQQCRVLSHIDKIIPEIEKQNIEVISKPDGGLNSGYFKLKCNKCNNIFEYKINNGRWQSIYCNSCHSSSIQKGIKEYLLSLTDNVIENDRTLLNGKELDLYLPEYKLAIEVDGIYWHSELQGKKRNYHISKTNECEKLGINLIHIFENEWIQKPEIIKSILSNKLHLNSNKIYARKTIVKEINNNEKREFLNDNHLQGSGKSKYKFGLYYNNELISVMTFGKRKITNKDPEYEIIRFASKLNTNVIGGASKLLKHFEKTYNPKKLITYADRRYSTNTSFYEKLGFSYIHTSKPNYWYFKKDKNLLSRVNFQKHKLVNKLETFDSELSEWKNMQNNDYNRIWDCGNYVFQKTY